LDARNLYLSLQFHPETPGGALRLIVAAASVLYGTDFFAMPAAIRR
jgi:hypothetical protein